MTKLIPTPEELQKLCEQIIACMDWEPLVLDDRAVMYDKKIDTYTHCIRIFHPNFWSFRVEMFGVDVKVSKPRRLWKLIHARCKEDEAASHARSVMEAMEKAREVAELLGMKNEGQK